MKRFSDQRAELIYHNGFCPGLPRHIGRLGHRKIHLLVAARTWDDVGVIAKNAIARFKKRPGRFGVPIDGRWLATFVWVPGVGAMEIALERG